MMYTQNYSKTDGFTGVVTFIALKGSCDFFIKYIYDIISGAEYKIK